MIKNLILIVVTTFILVIVALINAESQTIKVTEYEVVAWEKCGYPKGKRLPEKAILAIVYYDRGVLPVYHFTYLMRKMGVGYVGHCFATMAGEEWEI